MFVGFLTHLWWFYFRCIFSTDFYGPVYVCLLGVGNGAIGVGCEIGSELVMKTPQRCQWRLSGVFVVCFGHVSRYRVLFQFSTLGMQAFVGHYLLQKHTFTFLQQFWSGLILSHRLIGFMNKILQNEQCESSVDSFNAKIRPFKNFLRFYICSSFDFEFIFLYYILSHKFYFSQNVETYTSGKSFFILLYHRCRLV